jgi:hypothetical protein
VLGSTAVQLEVEAEVVEAPAEVVEAPPAPVASVLAPLPEEVPGPDGPQAADARRARSRRRLESPRHVL